MSDPAADAAQRAMGECIAACGDPGEQLGAVLNDLSRAAAREALLPLRELHRPVDGDPGGYMKVCQHCDTAWPCEDALSLYTTEELNNV